MVPKTIIAPQSKIALPTIALVIACGDSDHGWNGFFPEIQSFLLENYKLVMGQYFLLLRDGGATCLAYPRDLASDFLSLRSSMLRIRRLKPSIKDAFIFLHGPCGYYEDAVPNKNGDKMREKNDAPRILGVAQEIMHGIKVTGFFKPNSRQKTNFEPIP